MPRMRTLVLLRRRGSVTIILLGLLSVMLFLAFTLFQRQRGHGHLVAFGDSHLYARYFLEAHLGDVIQQLRQKVNDPGTAAADRVLFDFFRGDPAARFPAFYRPSPLVKQIPEQWQELGLDLSPVWEPEAKILDPKPLQYPPSLQVPPEFSPGLEKRGIIALTVRATLGGRRYSLSAQVPYSVVCRLSPVLRDFVFFADRLHLEQTRPFGREDRINIIFTKHPDYGQEPPPEFRDYKGLPWFFPMSNRPNDPHANGKIFLGADDKPIYLNLAGELRYRETPVSDLWMVNPRWFRANKNIDQFSANPIFMTRSGSMVRFRGMDIPLNLKGYIAKMGIFGFCYELYDPDNGLFSQTVRTPESIWGQDPSFMAMTAENKLQLALSSALKLYGPNYEHTLPLGQPYTGFARQVFGKVYARFLLLTFFEFPSAQGGGQVLPYNADGNYRPPPAPKYHGEETATFEPPEPGQKYTWFMSRIVSGGADRDVLADDYLPYNLFDPTGKGSRLLLQAKDFQPADGLRLNPNRNGTFAGFAREWMSFDPRLRLGQPGATLQSRVSRIFPNQKAFKEYARLSEGKCWIDGVVYVRGEDGLDLDDLTTKDIRGGIVIVEKGIRLGNITHGFPIKKEPIEDKTLLEQISDYVDTLPQSKVLTFVSREGSIRLKGDKHIGVQLVALTPEGGVRDQISWESPRGIFFAGGLVLDTPNLVARIKEFGRDAGKNVFLYVPSMADARPDTVVQIYPRLDQYDFALE